ncbi:uncharacterized protein LOC126897709 [Daktulosphaira vitifoliae]|uniref:uncharacterized protein LOC126897709 n=1 Tax=Daktulosphaira vitifoliae TaxID=58002 RepID=UPI0021A99877|nr:uncharacterized protein LOC126897709 [Daktulosphaira vitifoliae]
MAGIQWSNSLIYTNKSTTANRIKLSLNTLFLRLAEAKQSDNIENVLRASKHLSPVLNFCKNSISLNSNFRLVCHIRPEHSNLEISLSTLSLATSLEMMPSLSVRSYFPSNDIDLIKTNLYKLNNDSINLKLVDDLVKVENIQKYKKIKATIKMYNNQTLKHDSLPDILPPIAFSMFREELRLLMKGDEIKFNEEFKKGAKEQIKDNVFGDVDVEKNYETWILDTKEIFNRVEKLNAMVDEIMLVDIIPISTNQQWLKFLKENDGLFEDAKYKKTKLEKARYSLEINFKKYMERLLDIKHMRLKINKKELATDTLSLDFEWTLKQNIMNLLHEQRELHMFIGNVIDEINTQILKMLNFKDNIDMKFRIQKHQKQNVTNIE